MSSQTPSSGVAERSGTLLLDATYLVHIPSSWNGILLNDLDYAGGSSATPSRAFLLARGYGLSGTSRLQTRGRPNFDNQLATLDVVAREFGDPRAIIQMGCSGGGAVALWMAEHYADRIHGAIALCGTSPVMWGHIRTDQLFIAKTLLAPEDDEAVVLGRYEPDGMPQGEPAEMHAWLRILETAQATPLGRARVALTTALAQLPTWGGGSGEHSLSAPPDPADAAAVQSSMAETLVSAIRWAMVFVHGDLAANYSNTEVDFLAWYENTDPDQRRVVEELYADLGRGGPEVLRDDLARLQAAPRLHRSDLSVDPFWVAGSTGRPGVPVLHVTTMDTSTPPIVTGGYERLVRQNGLADRYRSAYVLRDNHCGFSVSETSALVDAAADRVGSGSWPDTSADALNARAAAFEMDEAMFVEHAPPAHSRVLTSGVEPRRRTSGRGGFRAAVVATRGAATE